MAVVCAVAMAQAQPAAELAIKWGPIISDLTTTSVRIGWVTSIPCRARVMCDGREFRSPVRGIYHEVVVDGLQPNSEHEYYVQAFAEAARAQSDTYVFRTPPPRLQRWSFIVLGDTRSRHDDHRKVVRAIMRAQPRPWLIVHTGDLVADGRKPEHWDMFFDIERPLLGTIPYYPVAGNHERESELYYKSFPVPRGGGPEAKGWYAAVVNGAMFIGLNSQIQLQEQADFLAEQLASAQRRGIKWRFVSWHAPPFSSGPHGGDEDIQKAWVPILEKFGVTAVFCGHDHLYEHSLCNDIHYITAGGGGAPLYPPGVKPNPYSVKAENSHHYVQVLVAPEAVQFRAVRTDGSLIEQFTVR